MNRKKITEIFTRLQKADPNPTTELIYSTPFELLIAVILSAQATDKSVNKATKNLFKVANTPEKMLKLGVKGLSAYIKTIGLYLTKSNHVIKTCELLVHKFHSKVPDKRGDLESLAGVGRKTANVILNTIFGEPTLAVDTHIFRVANRTGLATGTTPLQIEMQLLKKIPDEFKHGAHHWLILHGRYTCVARKPHCPTCLIRDLCEFKHKTTAADFA